MKMRFFIPVFLTLAYLVGGPVFAAAPGNIKAQQQQFHGALDTYIAANQKLETRIMNAASLDEQTRNFLLSLVRGEKSDFYTLRSSLFSTSTTKDIQKLAKLAQEKRAQMKLREERIITPLLQLSDFEHSALPTAEARVQTLDTTLTKSQYDRASEKLAAVRHDTETLHAELLGTHPPIDASKRLQNLHARTVNLYRDLRSKVK